MKALFFSISLVLSTLVYGSTDPQVAYEMAQDAKAIMVDVRELKEVEDGMVKGAVWLPLSLLRSDKECKEDFLKISKDKSIFVYCRTGRRSEEARKILMDEGIESENLGGFETLKETLPVEKPFQ